jgi:hypothetical protein
MLIYASALPKKELVNQDKGKYLSDSHMTTYILKAFLFLLFSSPSSLA